MATILNLDDFQTWQKARILNSKISELILIKKFDDYPRIKNQIITASFSIVSNLAEGLGRQGNREFIQFLSIAKASATELRSHLITVQDFIPIQQDKFKEILDLITSIEKMSGKLIQFLKKTDRKGAKFDN
jgi:four helix bundle protein